MPDHFNERLAELTLTKANHTKQSFIDLEEVMATITDPRHLEIMKRIRIELAEKIGMLSADAAHMQRQAKIAGLKRVAANGIYGSRHGGKLEDSQQSVPTVLNVASPYL